MTESTPTAEQVDQGADAAEARKRPWPVTALALFLLLQAAGLLGLAAYHVIFADPVSGELTADFKNLQAILYLLLFWLALFSAVGFFRLWLNSWLMAMFLQGLCLITALILYFQSGPDYVYGIMIYAVFMVVYLNHYEARDAFHARKLLMTDLEEWRS